MRNGTVGIGIADVLQILLCKKSLHSAGLMTDSISLCELALLQILSSASAPFGINQVHKCTNQIRFRHTP